MSRARWHRARRRCLTASWVPAVLGAKCPAGTAFDAWAYLRHGIGQAETRAMRVGRILELPILRLFSEDSGIQWRRHRQDRIVGGHPDIWGATPDAVTIDPAGCPIEAKSAAWGGPWIDGPPLAVLIQLQVQLHCLGAAEGYVAALVEGDFRFWAVARDQAFIDRARAYCLRWWGKHIVGGAMPEIDHRPETAQILAQIYKPRCRARAARLPAPAGEIRQMLQNAREVSRWAKQESGLRANQLRALLGQDAYGVCPDGEVVSHVAGQLRLPSRLPRSVEPPNPWRD